MIIARNYLDVYPYDKWYGKVSSCLYTKEIWDLDSLLKELRQVCVCESSLVYKAFLELFSHCVII